MFLFNSLHQGNVVSGSRKASRNRNGFSSLRRHWARSVFALVVMLCLSTAFLFTGCEESNSGVGSIPVGEWADTFGGGYKITKSSLEYYTADSEWEGVTYPGESIKGTISEAIDFSKDAGVLLVKITESSTSGQIGKFFGVYYKDHTASHIFLANAIDESYALILKDTLAEAKSTFTVDNVGTHVTMWGSGYSK